jgi:hypothetical protein
VAGKVLRLGSQLATFQLVVLEIEIKAAVCRFLDLDVAEAIRASDTGNQVRGDVPFRDLEPTVADRRHRGQVQVEPRMHFELAVIVLPQLDTPLGLSCQGQNIAFGLARAESYTQKLK